MHDKAKQKDRRLARILSRLRVRGCESRIIVIHGTRTVSHAISLLNERSLSSTGRETRTDVQD